MVGRRDTGHRGQGDVRHGTLCVQPFWPPKKHFICGPSKKRTSVVWFLATKRRRSLCTIHAIPQAACRSGAMRLGPVGADRRRRYLRITLLMTPSPIEVVATSFIERGLDEVDPWSADRSP